MRLLAFILILVLLALQYRLWVGEGSFADVYNLRHQVTEQEKGLAWLKERNRALQAEVQDLKQGEEAVEELARSELGMIKQGEIFYHLVEPSPAQPGGQKK